MSTAFVLGNGKSRLVVDLDLLKSRGKVYGCNWLYKTFVPDCLVATDRPIADAIQNSGYAKENRFHTRKPIPNLGGQPLDNKYKGFSSGPNAIALAAAEEIPYIFLIGFDLASETKLINNIYSGTAHYAPSDALTTNSDNWINQIYEIAEKYKNQRFIHVNPLIGYTPESWETLANFEAMDLTGFRSMLNI